MIINNLGQASLSDNTNGFCNTQWDVRDIQYKVTSDDGQFRSGSIAYQQFAEVPDFGKAPYSVEMGFLNYSYTTTATGVAATSVVSFLMIYPTGTNLGGNGPRALVNVPEASEQSKATVDLGPLAKR